MKKRGLLLVSALIVVGIGGYFLLRPEAKPVIPLPTKSYVALGDSVAAGVGLKYDSDSSACDRTNQSYPYVVAQRLHYSLHTVACSGATIESGILGTQSVNELQVSPQLDQLFAQPKPDLISITIGANDAGWADVIRECYLSQCGSTTDTAAIDARLSTLQTSLQTMLTRLHDHYGTSQPTTVVTDYYQVYPASKPAGCGSLIGLSDAELSWLRDQRTKINSTIKDSLNGHASFVFADADFTNHELCAKDTWVQGLTASNPYHPTAAGQAAIASQVVSAYKEATAK